MSFFYEKKVWNWKYRKQKWATKCWEKIKQKQNEDENCRQRHTLHYTRHNCWENKRKMTMNK